MGLGLMALSIFSKLCCYIQPDFCKQSMLSMLPSRYSAVSSAPSDCIIQMNGVLAAKDEQNSFLPSFHATQPIFELNLKQGSARA